MASLVTKLRSSSGSTDLSMKLFVGQVPKDVDEAELQPHFEKYGPVSSIKVCRDRDTQQHKGCAFVTFDSVDDADAAIQALHDKVMLPGGKKELQVKEVHTEDGRKFGKRLFIGMIAKSLNTEDLKEMFSKFGVITDANVLIDKAENKSRGCGFLKFEKASSCLAAIQEMHQSTTMEGCNSALVVKHADTPADKHKRMSSGFEDRTDFKRPSYNQSIAPYHAQQQSYPQYHEPRQPEPAPPAQNATAMALINAFTPLLNTLAQQNNPGTTAMLVKSIEIALNALKRESSPQAHTALVSIASNLSVAVANNLTRNQPPSNYSASGDPYNSVQTYTQQQDYPQYPASSPYSSNPQYSPNNSAPAQNSTYTNVRHSHYNFSASQY